MGYDVEAGTSGDHNAGTRDFADSEVTKRTIERVAGLHEKHEVPGTLFVVGRKIESEPDIYRPLVDHRYLDIEQHTYDHTSLKPVVVTRGGKVELQDFPTHQTAEDVRADIRKTNAVFKDLLGITCRGLSTPFAYFMGLADRPDILAALDGEGIKYFRSFHLNKEPFAIREPLPFEYHPFDHTAQGFPDTVDFCIKGYSDVTWALRFGWDASEGFISYVKQALHVVEQTDSVWGLVLHDWSIYKIDPSIKIVAEILQYATRLDVEILSFGEAYDRLVGTPFVRDVDHRKVDWRVNFVRRV